MDPESETKAGFQRAADRFKASVPPKLFSEFSQRSNSISSLKDEIKTIQKEHGASGSLRNMPRLRRFIEAMTQFGQVIEVFVNANDFVCFIWGPMKFLLGVAKTHLDTFDKLLDAYAQIGDAIPGLSVYKGVFEQHETLKVVMQDYFSDILRFHEEAIKIFARSKMKDLFHAAWKTFDAHFGPILQSLRSRRELLESEKLSASLEHVHIIRRRIEELYKDQVKAADMQALETHRSGMARIKEMLRPPTYFEDQAAAFRRREAPGTGEWIFEEPRYISWADPNTPGHSVLYINGIPGAGKSTLVSLIVRRLLETYVEQKTPHSVAYFYFKHMKSEKNNHQSFLRAILSQLISQDAMVLQEVSAELQYESDENFQSQSNLEALTKTALEGYGVSFLVLDGLDECDSQEACITIQWLVSLVEGSRALNKADLRVIISSQRDGLVDRQLSSYPAISLESTKHQADIEKYCLHYAKRFRQRFPLKNDLENAIVLLVLDGARGKYARIVANISRGKHESQRKAAKKILGFLVASKRDLKWREIQSLFCIKTRPGTVDLDERLQNDAKELCGSLVDTHGLAAAPSDPESIVQIVHSTARRYLIEEKIINETLANARLLSFCCRYLVSPPFAHTNQLDVISLHARQAYYSMQDYAVANWYGHLQALGDRNLGGSDETPKLARQLRKATRATRRFLTEYGSSMRLIKNIRHCPTPREILGNLPQGEKDLVSFLDFEQRTTKIRREIESLEHLPDEERIVLEWLYGPLSTFKCPKPACSMFSEGFATAQERDKHVQCHERPFLCNVEDCFGYILGFVSAEALHQHQAKYHSEAPTSSLFPWVESQKNAKSVHTKNLRTAVYSGHLHRVIELLDDGANIDKRWNGYETPLWVAANRGDYDICKLLIERGATLGKPKSYHSWQATRPNADGMTSYTPLATACDRGFIKIVNLILSAHVKTDTLGDSAIHIGFIKAVTRDRREIVRLLLGSYDFMDEEGAGNFRGNPVREACRRGHVDMLSLLLQNGFQSKADNTCIGECMRSQRKGYDWQRKKMILKTLLSAGCLEEGIHPDKILNAIVIRQPLIAALFLSHSKTELATEDLTYLRDISDRFPGVVKLIDKRLAVEENNAIPLLFRNNTGSS